MPFGWIGNILIIFGAWIIGYKRHWGFLLTIIGGLCWLFEGICLCRFDLIFIESIMVIVAIRNFFKWQKND